MDNDPLSNIKVDIARIQVTLEVQAGQLKEHMRRSEANEQAVAVMERTLAAHLGRMNVVIAILAVVGTGLTGALIKLIFL